MAKGSFFSTDTITIADLQSRYGEACEKLGVPQHFFVLMAFSKVKAEKENKEMSIFELNLDQLTESDLLPFMEVLSLMHKSELDAVDVVHKSAASNDLMLLKALRSVGTKLRTVDFKRNVFGREILRDLFHKGIQCQELDLSYSRVKKLDMTGQFSQLHTLIMDFSVYLTSLPEGCFRAMPKLARLSLCETRIANLWTTCAALSKLPALAELRFQSCKCCQGTGPCVSFTFTEKSGVFSEESHRANQLGNAWTMDWASLGMDDFDSERSESSRSDEDDSDEYFSDDDPALYPQQLNTSSEESLLDMELIIDEQDGQWIEVGNIEVDDAEEASDATFYPPQGNVSHTEEIRREEENSSSSTLMEALNTAEQSVNIGSLAMSGYGVSGGEREYREREDDGSSRGQQLEGIRDSIEALCTEVASDIEAFLPSKSDSFSSVDMVNRENSMKNAVFGERKYLTRCRSSHPSRICFERYYREFLIARLPGLKVLDNWPVVQAEREKAQVVFWERFELLPHNHKEKENIIDVLRRREAGALDSGLPTTSTKRRRVGGATLESQSSVAFRRSLCAVRMASSSWPSCIPICKSRKLNAEFNRKCRPRQFEYHPADPSLMVFGTLHGEVVVVNHESDKVVGYVQSSGSSQSILGLCWLNRDPNKLIAGSDSGSLRLYDVNRLRASYLNGQSEGRAGSAVRSLSSSYNNGNGQRNPAIYTYDDFEQLTSVHISSTDQYFLASGYSHHVGLYDLGTGKRLKTFQDLHQEHINVVKFSHHSPHLFATSSFDKDIKMWDLRQGVVKPLYTVRSVGGNVMVCFSCDDHYLLSSAVDNEVKQHLAVDGRMHTKFDIAPTGSAQNYTRSYYMNGRDYIITGSCEEDVVHICCARTGRRLRDVALESHGSKTSIYVQSLRGDPFRDFNFSVLAAYLHPLSKSVIMKVNLLASSSHRRSYEIEPQAWVPAGRGA